MNDECRNELNEILITTAITILTIFLYTTNTNYLENTTPLENMKLEKNINIEADILINYEKLNINPSNSLENYDTKIFTNFDVIRVNMMHDLNHQN